jgi:flagellar hook assembly protein FlgD
MGFIPLLVRGLQEQQVIIEQLKQEVQELKGKTVYTDVDKTKLFQNNPNPFRGTTTFTYYIDESTNVSGAVIEIRNIMGTLQNSITLGDKSGLGKIEFNAENLAEGYYVYALKVNGNLKDSKMLLIGE